MFEKMEFDHVWLFTTTATYFFLLPMDLKKCTQKLYTKQNSQFKAPLEQGILIEHLCLHNSCLSGNPKINKNCLIRNCTRSSTHEKMSKESSRKPQTDYQLHDTSFSLFSANKEQSSMTTINTQTQVHTLPLLKWTVFYAK